jgi:hypothetical protein
MEKQRDKSGRFVKGHGGFKPVGAISKKKRKQKYLMDEVLIFLEDQMEELIPLLTPTERVKLYKDLLAYVIPKMKRISHHELEKPKVKKPTKYVFEIVGGGKATTSEKTIGDNS